MTEPIRPPLPNNPEVQRESLIWGEGYPTKENHSNDLKCINPECTNATILFGNTLDNKDSIIGVKEAPWARQDRSYHLALMCECPSCFTRYWHHISESDADMVKMIKFEL